MDNYSVQNEQNTEDNGEFVFVPTKKPKRNKLPLIAGALVAIALIITLIALVFSGSDVIIPTESDLSAVYDADSGKTKFYAGGKLLPLTVDGEIEEEMTSMDGSVMVFIISEEKDDKTEEIVYYTDGKEVRKIATEVSDLIIAPNGKSCVYLMKDEENEEHTAYKLFLYNFKGGEGVQVSKKVPSSSAYTISADGESVLYNEYVSGSTDTKMYLYKDGASEPLGKNLIPMGVSEDAKYVYYYDVEKNVTYVRNAKDERIKIANEQCALIFNYDGSEVLTQTDNGVYVMKDGDEATRTKIAKKISSVSFQGVAGMAQSSSKAGYYGVKTFAGMSYVDYDDGDKKLYRLDKNYERIEIAKDVEDLQLSGDGSKLYLVRDDDLYCGKPNGDASDFDRIAADVDSYKISQDGSICYYLDDDDTLYYVDGSKTGAKIAEDVDIYCVTADGYVLFITDRSSETYEGTLYSAYKDGGKERVADDVYSVYATNHGTYYKTKEVSGDGTSTTYTVYGASKKANFEKIFTYED